MLDKKSILHAGEYLMSVANIEGDRDLGNHDTECIRCTW